MLPEREVLEMAEEPVLVYETVRPGLNHRGFLVNCKPDVCSSREASVGWRPEQLVHHRAGGGLETKGRDMGPKENLFKVSPVWGTFAQFLKGSGSAAPLPWARERCHAEQTQCSVWAATTPLTPAILPLL